MDGDRDTAQDTTEDAYQDAGRDDLVADLRDQVRFMREELARKDAILLNMTETMRQLTAPHEEAARGENYSPYEPPGASQTATEQPGRVGPQSAVEGAQEPQEWPELVEDEQQGRGPAPDATGTREQPSEALGGPRSGTARGSWWRRMFGG